ncbi:MAG: leucine-rich repeat protein [Clostridia bacterium]|nr:leucine-rich repeat protein [Clostridia bacterium]
MKKILLFCLVALVLFLSSCTVHESPEPLFEPEPVTTENRNVTGSRHSSGLTFRTYSDNTCEISEVNEADWGSTKMELPSHFEEYKIVAVDPGVFRDTSFSSIALPSELERIGEGAFEHAKLTEVVLPDTVTEIGKEAFASCVQLEKVTLSKALTEIPEGAFYGCRSLRKIVIPEGVKVIGDEAFGDIPVLKQVTLPEGLEAIGGWAFWSCGIEKDGIEIPDSVAAIGKEAFASTPWLEAQKEEWVIVGKGVLLRYNGTDSEITLPDRVLYLSNAFEKHDLKSLTLPDTLQGIAPDALEGISPDVIRYEGTSEEITALLPKKETP